MEASAQTHYIDSEPALPANQPFGFPHILHPAAYAQTVFQTALSQPMFHPADAITTMLYRYDRAVLYRFLDFGNYTFEFDRQQNSDEWNNWVVIRSGNVVKFGVYQDRGLGIWDLQATYRINNEGIWLPMRGIEMNQETYDVDDIERLGQAFASALLESEEWNEFPGATTVVSVSTL